MALPSDTDPHPGPTPPDLARLRIDRSVPRRRRYRAFPWLSLIVLAALAGGAWLNRDALRGLLEEATGPRFATARAQRVVPGAPAEAALAANGYVVAGRQASVATVLSGRLLALYAEEGDVVDAGAALARIQFDDYETAWHAAEQRVAVAEAQVKEAEAAVEAARLELPALDAVLVERTNQVSQAEESRNRLEREVQRNRPLHAQRVIADGVMDQIQADARTAREAVEAAKARLTASRAARAAWEGRIRRQEAALVVAQSMALASREEAQVARITLEKTWIRAPFRGLVVRKDAEVGEVIAPTGAGNSRGSVFTIVDPDSLEVQVELSERRIRRVHEGDAATIHLDADPDTAWPARVRKIWPRADRSKGTIELRIALRDRPGDLRPEMSARVAFLGEPEPAPTGDAYVTVPLQAVAKRRGLDAVFVLTGGTARLVPVTLGDRRDGGIVVLQGLEGGEEVLLDPPADLQDGSDVDAGRET